MRDTNSNPRQIPRPRRPEHIPFPCQLRKGDAIKGPRALGGILPADQLGIAVQKVCRAAAFRLNYKLIREWGVHTGATVTRDTINYRCSSRLLGSRKLGGVFI